MPRTTRNILLGLAAALLLAGCKPVAAPPPADARPAIEAAMRDSAAGWNAGDLDRFMAIYADDPATSFVTKDGLIRGKATIAARYAPSFAVKGGNSRGTLSFTFLDLRPIDADHALLTARYRLTPADPEAPLAEGPTTLLFRRNSGTWKIVADHSG